MFQSWLNPNKSYKDSLKGSSISHYVLGSIIDKRPGANEEEIFFGCGCFWGAEKGFWKLPGVTTTAVGYLGGTVENPGYRQVCSGRTGHAEVVRVVWDKSKIDISDLLKMFWECHDPTQLNRQGNDSGTQYRSAIFTTTSQQNEIALNSLQAYQRLITESGLGEIKTQIETAKTFYYAEEYHQQYLAKPGSRPYCSAMPTNISLNNFKSSNYKLSPSIWDNFNWEEKHCVLRSTNSPIDAQNNE